MTRTAAPTRKRGGGRRRTKPTKETGRSTNERRQAVRAYGEMRHVRPTRCGQEKRSDGTPEAQRPHLLRTQVKSITRPDAKPIADSEANRSPVGAKRRAGLVHGCE